MRQKLSLRKVNRWRRATGHDAVGALVRGGTGHRVDLMLRGGAVLRVWPDGEEEIATNLSHRFPVPSGLVPVAPPFWIGPGSVLDRMRTKGREVRL